MVKVGQRIIRKKLELELLTEISHQVGNHDQGSQKHDLVDVLDQDAEVGYGEDEVDKEYYIVLDLHLQFMGLFFNLPWLAWMYIDIVDPHRCITDFTTLFDESIKQIDSQLHIYYRPPSIHFLSDN